MAGMMRNSVAKGRIGQYALTMNWRASIAALTCTLVLLVPLGAARADGEIGSFRKASGEIVIIRDAAEMPASEGTAVFKGDVVRAGPAGTAKVDFVDGTVLTVSPHTRIALDRVFLEPSTGRYSSSFELHSGKVRTQVGGGGEGKGASFEIRTPTAVAETGASDFLVSYFTDEEVTEVVPFNGSVAVQSIADVEHRASVVKSGQSLLVSRTQVGTDIRPLERRHFNQLLEGLDMSVALAGGLRTPPPFGALPTNIVPAPSVAATSNSSKDAGDLLGGSPFVDNVTSLGIIFDD